MSELIDIIISAVDQASETFESIVGSAEDAASSIEGMGDSAENVPSDAIQETAEATGQAGEEAENANSTFDAMGDIIATIGGAEVFSQMADTIMDLADKAGNFNDSMMRASLEAEGAGISVGDMKNAVSDLSDETGRAGGQIREAFINATARGVTDMDSFKKMMEGAGAQATLFGTDIESMGNKFSQMAMRSTLMERGLASTGITMDELATAMGMTGATADEVKEKWKELDANQRAAALGMAASMNEGEEANEAYKNSWAGLHEQIDIAKGKIERLAGQIFLPVLIPAMQAAGNVLEWLGDVFGAVMDGPLGTFVSVIGSVAAGIALAIPAIIAIKGAIALFSTVIWPAVTASWALLAPWLPWIAIGAAIVLIIYEIGKAFGWWNDASSMIDAISAGLQRLWNAFINHPDVQAAITTIGEAFGVLAGWIGQAWQAILDFFGVSTDSNFDVVHAIILSLGEVWEYFKTKIQTAATVATAFYQIISWIASSLWSVFGPVIMAIVTYVQNLINIFNSFKTGQINLPQAILMVLQSLLTMYSTIFNAIMGKVVQFGTQLIQKGISAARGCVNSIINWLRQLPGRVYSALLSVVGKISSAIAHWASTASSKVQDVISKITSPFRGVPSAISGALGGVASAISAPFQAAWNTVKPWLDKIEDGMNKIKNMSWGGETAYGGEIATTVNGQSFNIQTGAYTDNSPIEVNQTITLDLQNVPVHIDTTTLINALTDKTVLSALTGNRDFQELDNRMKARIDLKTRRSGH